MIRGKKFSNRRADIAAIGTIASGVMIGVCCLFNCWCSSIQHKLASGEYALRASGHRSTESTELTELTEQDESIVTTQPLPSYEEATGEVNSAQPLPSYEEATGEVNSAQLLPSYEEAMRL